MDEKWKLSEKQLQKLLLVKTVLIGVRKTCIDEEIEHETSKGTESERIEAIVTHHKHDKTLSETIAGESHKADDQCRAPRFFSKAFIPFGIS
jgi:hypothetical protein